MSFFQSVVVDCLQRRAITVPVMNIFAPFYMWDQWVLTDIRNSFESVISNCQDIDIHLGKMIQTTRAFVDRYSNNLSSVTLNFNDDVVNASMFNAIVVDDASSTTVSSTHVVTSMHTLFAGIRCNSEYVLVKLLPLFVMILNNFLVPQCLMSRNSTM